MDKSAKRRDSNLELLRIVAMLMILSYHACYHGVVQILSENPYSVFDAGTLLNKSIVVFLSPGGEVGVALFFILSGYFGGGSGKTLFRAFLQIIWYGCICVCIWAAGNILGVITLSGYTLWRGIVTYVLVPISSREWWFVSIWFIVVIFARSFLEILYEKTSRQGVTIILFLFVLFPYGLSCIYGLPSYLMWKGLLFFAIGMYIRQYGGGISSNNSIVYYVCNIMDIAGSGKVFLRQDLCR